MSNQNFQKVLILFLVLILTLLSACSAQQGSEATSLPAEQETEPIVQTDATVTDPWDPMYYQNLEDVQAIIEVQEGNSNVVTYCMNYISDNCRVRAYLSIPKQYFVDRKQYSCLIFNRGGNRDFSINSDHSIATYAEVFNSIVFASDYRGCSTGTGKDEFGGDDVHDVLKLIDIAEQFAFVDKDRMYMLGVSRGGMMAYLALKEDIPIQKGIILSGLADLFINYEYREDMREKVYGQLIGGSPEELPEEYIKRSATYWADEIKCPLLIIHSKLDKRVSYQEAVKMTEALDAAGKEYKFVSYEDDAHGILRAEDTNIIKEWCNLGPKGND